MSSRGASRQKKGSYNAKKGASDNVIRIVDEDSLNFWDWSSAKECKSCRSRKMLKDEYFVAKISVDTAANAPSKKGVPRLRRPAAPRADFTGLVLCCIDSYDSEQRRILQHFSRSTRFAFFCTAQISKFQQKTVQIFAGMKMKFHFSFAFFDEICDFSAKIWWKFSGISQKLSGNDKMSRDFEKKCEKILENARNFKFQ